MLEHDQILTLRKLHLYDGQCVYSIENLNHGLSLFLLLASFLVISAYNRWDISIAH